MPVGEFTFGSLFAGVGGFDLGLERAGMTIKWQVENDPFCNRVLEKHWPNVKRFGDIRECGSHNLADVDLICGGFPCQPFSVAGKRQGKADDRYLWPEMLRIISEIKPTWVIGENVTGILHMDFDDMLTSLEAEGYETQTLVLPACGIGARHRRDRVWILAWNTDSMRCSRNGWEKREIQNEDTNANRICEKEILAHTINDSEKEEVSGINRQTGRAGMFGGTGSNSEDVADISEPGLEGQKSARELRGQRERLSTQCGWWDIEPNVGRVANGVPSRVDRLRGLGNAVVPQVVEVIGKAIMCIGRTERIDSK